MNGNHLKYMLLGGAGLFGVLLVVGVPLTSALLFAVVLACPLMMFTMGGGHAGHGAEHDQGPTSRRTTNGTESIDRPSEHRHQP